MNKEQISLKLPPENKWVPMLAETVRHYSSILNIPDLLCSMISDSLLEGCEELIRICQEKKITEEFEVSLDFNNEAVIVKIIFNGKIPLNPQELEDYEVPDSQEDLMEVDLDSLWLFLIKKRMDRVFFKVDGNIQTLQMMKYQRKEENKRQYWIMGLSPKLKKDVVLDMQGKEKSDELAGGAILQNRETGNVLKLDKTGAFIAQKLNGEQTFQEIYMDCIDSLGMVSPQTLGMIYEKLEQAEMLEGAEGAGGGSFFRRILCFVLNPDFSIPGADRVVTGVYKLFTIFFNPLGVFLLLGVGLSGIIPLIKYFPQLKDVVFELGDYYFQNPYLLIGIYFSALLIIIIHEFGHGLVCKHYGGYVGRLGVMFYLTMFIFYCDTSSAWNFSKKKERLMVSLGGPLTTFCILGILLWFFGNSVENSSSLMMFWGTLSLFCVFGLIMNLNPFIKMDAYYILMDLSGITNLRHRSFQFLKEAILSVAPVEKASKPLTVKEKNVFWFYGLTGFAVTVLFLLLPLVYYSWQLLADGNRKDKVVFATIIILLTLLKLAQNAFRSISSMRKKVYRIS